jgi:hypothetical protein
MLVGTPDEVGEQLRSLRPSGRRPRPSEQGPDVDDPRSRAGVGSAERALAAADFGVDAALATVRATDVAQHLEDTLATASLHRLDSALACCR